MNILKSAPSPAQILNRLRLQPKNLGSDRLLNTGKKFHIFCRRFLQKAAKKQLEGSWMLLNIFPMKQVPVPGTE